MANIISLKAEKSRVQGSLANCMVYNQLVILKKLAKTRSWNFSSAMTVLSVVYMNTT